ncbi:serine hydrolase domain-containing protein [Geodermatophilus sp. SYSU D00965]
MSTRRTRLDPVRTRLACVPVAAASLVVAGLVSPATAARAVSQDPDPALVADLRADLEAYLQERGAAEHVSGAGLTVDVPGEERVDVSAGTTEFGGSVPVGPDALWQIGSNTKAFTSVLLLQLEAEGRLSIEDTVTDWLPQYPQWADVPIRRLLDMTSGIPTYDDQQGMLADYAADPLRDFSPKELIAYVDGVPATSGYSYSNTNYVLGELIVEAVTGESYEDQLYDRIIDPLDLEDTHYRPHLYPDEIADRMPAGYYTRTGDPGLAPLRGQDVSRDSLSWARGAGGILATTADMTRWERALYEGDLLPPQQQDELESLVSTATGQPIESTSAEDPMGFALGIAQMTDDLGTFWFYEGQTLGFRALHVYFPDSGVIAAVNLNSSPDEDRIGALATTVYGTLTEHGLVPPAQQAA